MKYNPQKHHRQSIRLKGYDYSQAGAYFITICVMGRQHLFGQVVNKEMVLNQMGQIAYEEWLNTPLLRPNVSLDVFVIMPNHIHGIILINEIDPPSKGELHSPLILHTPIILDNGGTGELHSPILNNGNIGDFKSPSNNIGAIIRGYKSAVTKQINSLNHDSFAWQRNYYEHIIRNDLAYQRISDYINNNPSKWDEDKFFTE